MADFDDFDDLKFKPVTKGLGFHHQEKNEIKKFNRVTPLESANLRDGISSTTQASSPSAISKNDLALFYGEQNNSEIDLPRSFDGRDAISRPVRESASHASRIVAGIIDETVVLLMTASTLLGFALLLGGKLELIFHRLPWHDLIFYSVALYSIYFTSYFTILDPQATLGKSLLKIRVVCKRGDEKMTFSLSFIRALICCFAPIALFIPYFLDWQGKATDTDVIDR